jgi:VanZ family protein
MRGRRILHLTRQTRLKLALWACLIAIIVLSLVPGDARPHTGAPGEFEHFVAYLGTGLFIAARHRTLRGRLAFWASIAGLSFALEYFQQFVPGRQPDVFDALASSSGLTMGMLFGGLLIGVTRRRRSFPFGETAVDPAE